MTNLLLKVPLALALGAYLTGMALGHLFAGPYIALLFGSGLLLILPGLILTVLVRRTGFWQTVGYILVMAGFIPLGWANYIRSRQLPDNHISRFFDPDEQTQLTGRLTKPPEYLGKRYYLYLEAEQVDYRGKNIPVNGLVRLTCYIKNLDLEYGERLRLRARLNYPRNYENPGGFNYRAYMARRGIRVIGSVTGGIEKLGTSGANPLWQAVYRLKSDIAVFISRNCPQPQAGLLRMMVWGERYALHLPVKEQFQRIGLAHLLAISGLHVSFLSLLVFGFFRLVFRLLPFRLYERLVRLIRPKKLAAVLTIPAVVFYTMIAGASNSAVRSAIMILTLMLAVILNRQRQLFNTLALAALLILLWNPQSIREVDFQLSFACVFFIIYAFYILKSPGSADFIPDNLSIWQRWGNWSKEFVVVSLAAYMAALPLSVFYFYELSPWAMLANLIGIPVSWPIIPLGLISGVVSPVWPGMALVLMKLNLLFVDLLLKLVDSISRLPYASIKLAPPDIGWLAVYYVLLLGIWWLARRSWIYLGLGVALWGGIWFLNATDLLVPPVVPIPRLQVTFLDVGQAEAIFIRLPDGRCMMVDGGGSYGFDIGEQVISPYLWHEKVKKIDVLVMTHHHPDHIKGFLAVVKNFRVGECWQSPAECTTPVYMELKALMEARGIPIREVAAGDDFSWPAGIKLHFLHPPRNPDRPFGRDADDRENNNSLVFILEYGRIKILFTGDIGWQVEKYLVRQQIPLACTVLKVPHHGSPGSSTFQLLNAANPVWAVVSRRPIYYKWRRNTKTFSRYEEKHIKIWSTDVNGAVTLYTDGKDLSWEVFSSESPVRFVPKYVN